jgi:hypothetical protein
MTDGQLKGMLDRKLIELTVHNPGSGRPRLFAIADLIKVAVARELAAIGVPMWFLTACAFVVLRRAHLFFQANPVIKNPTESPRGFIGQGWQLVIWRTAEGAWSVAERRADDDGWWKEEGPPPLCYVLLNVDEIIGDVASRVVGAVDGAAA